MTLEKAVYTAHAKATGGRDGRATTSDGHLDVQLAVPKIMGGTGNGTNPEQLFAAGYSACFLGAMKFVSNRDKISITPAAYVIGIYTNPKFWVKLKSMLFNLISPILIHVSSDDTTPS